MSIYPAGWTSKRHGTAVVAIVLAAIAVVITLPSNIPWFYYAGGALSLVALMAQDYFTGTDIDDLEEQKQKKAAKAEAIKTKRPRRGTASGLPG